MKVLLLLLCTIIPVLADAQTRYSIVINEIMADPAPRVGLPDHEWIEILNTSEHPINLRGWRLGDNTTLSGYFPDQTLAAKQYLILCASSARTAMQPYGEVLAVPSFPSLDNAGEQLYLLSPDNKVIHAIRYADNWHDNTLKKEGGWSLEMIDAQNPCSGQSNWSSSNSPAGGTPGQPNTIAGINTDNSAPVPLRSYHSTLNRLIVVFNEPLDSITAVNLSNYRLIPAINIIKVVCRSPLFEEVELETDQPLDSLTVYELMINNVRDCQQNEMLRPITIKAGISSSSAAAKPVINEILFNPRPNGYDYVEIFNPGPLIIDVNQLYLANRNASGLVSNTVRISSTPYTLFPGEYLVATANPSVLNTQYFVMYPNKVLEVSLPSYPDDRGTVILMSLQGGILDEVNYSKDWHFKLIADPDGVALERVDPQMPAAAGSNWHSAASTVGHGTPTYQNSQFMTTPVMNAEIDLLPKVFSPDNDGIHDQVQIIYRTATSGLMANVMIFDIDGRLVRDLVRNQLLGASGYWNWDGIDDRQQLLPVGRYIIQVELFTLSGENRRIKKVVVLAKRLR
ncbi:lamin tail domain-containing protein [Terrimonas sp. NA20]|uniref:Lamin tail domain-containing protein n=1 Tax=Terrimonas ginsenosidimutans TaxID=2908004 RepID=A0ABS9KUW0_9BACT|nr:lamin tail domain-containing protein [Terrimonas ginsenosidimutans]MCG2616137.1 lamin tail domain-containing protein [Terrimonas ginsenosidimutans]